MAKTGKGKRRGVIKNKLLPFMVLLFLFVPLTLVNGAETTTVALPNGGQDTAKVSKGKPSAVGSADKKDGDSGQGKTPAPATKTPAGYQLSAKDINGIAKLPTVPITDLEELAAKTAGYHPGEDIKTVEKDGRDFCLKFLKIPVPGQKVGVIPILVIGTNAKHSYEDHLTIVYFDESGKEQSKRYDLSKFSAIYKYITGRELKWGMLLGEPVQDSKQGTYVNMYVVPLADPKGTMKVGSVVMVVSYTDYQIGPPVLDLIK